MANPKDRSLETGFLWRGETPDKVYGGHSLVNWPTTCWPKGKGGLGILELERFAKALRLRWLWFQWKHKDHAWNELELSCDSRDCELFAASMAVTLGDGKTAQFWTSSWIKGTTARSLAPTLFQKAKRKKISVQKAIHDNRWISHILSHQTAQEIQEYVVLWEKMHGVSLQENIKDSIQWRWTNNGEYMTAYQIQIEGSFCKLRLTPIGGQEQNLHAGFSLGHYFIRRYLTPTT